jgi:hypothetical protein
LGTPSGTWGLAGNFEDTYHDLLIALQEGLLDLMGDENDAILLHGQVDDEAITEENPYFHMDCGSKDLCDYKEDEGVT